jgi:DNA-binding transcriptional MerR regulator
VASTHSDDELTIDELARRTGMTVRNVRAHQSRGLLPPPDVRGRTGFYTEDHVARLELVKELQADGFNLEAIRRLLEDAGGSSLEVLRFTRHARSAFDQEKPEIVEADVLAERFGADPELLRRAIELGFLRPLGAGRFEQPSPRLARAAQRLTDLGIPPGRTLDVSETLRRHAEGVADAYVRLFIDEVWRPFVEAGRPADRWDEVEDALERLRPLAAETLTAIFGLVMTERVEQAVERQLFGEDGSAGEPG